MIDYSHYLTKLSEQFYSDFPKDKFPEILEKQTRSYNCVVCQIDVNLFICIPYRSNINHKNSYIFKNSSRGNKSGLDYTKLVVFKDKKYLDKTNEAIINKNEYKETIRNIDKIVKEVFEYIHVFLKHHKGIEKLHIRKYTRNYGYSTLPYFVEILSEINK